MRQINRYLSVVILLGAGAPAQHRGHGEVRGHRPRPGHRAPRAAQPQARRHPLGQAREQFRIGRTVLLHGHTPLGKRQRILVFVERSEQITPGVGLGHGERDGYV